MDAGTEESVREQVYYRIHAGSKVERRCVSGQLIIAYATRRAEKTRATPGGYSINLHDHKAV